MADETGSRTIPVRDRRQAREWGLALISQGIESTLLQDDDTGNYALLVEADRCGEALRVIKHYHIENRGWGLSRELPGTRLVFHWGALGWAVLMVIFYYFSSLGPRVREMGAMDREALGAGEWWRIFTAMTLHADVGHLLSNLATGLLFLGLVMARHGPGIGLLGAWTAGAMANVSAMLVYPDPYRSLGASGMVLAMLGILTVTGIREARERQPGWRALLGSLGAGVMLFALTGSNPASDLVVHLGGFLWGLVVGVALERFHSRTEDHERMQPAGFIVFGLLLVTAWVMALKA